MKRGSITLFCMLCMMLVASLLFVLLESARVNGLERYASLKADTGIDSVCAQFQPLLWQQYGLLFLDGAYGTEHFSTAYVTENLTEQIDENLKRKDGLLSQARLDLFGLSLEEAVLEEYALATDDSGELFLNYIAERMKENLPLGMAEDLYERYQKGNEICEEYSGAEESITKAQQILADIKAKSAEENAVMEEQNIDTDTYSLEQTWNSIASMNQSGMLKLILEDLSVVSEKASKPKSDLQTRKKAEGNMQTMEQADWYRKILVLAYLEQYFTNYTNHLDGHFLAYEMEYVLCGKDTEWENLEATLKQILLIREAANIAYLLQDEEKMQIAGTMANLIGLLAQGNPAVVEVLKAGIIGAWAYLESILDVRALVSGDCIPLIKSKEEWTTDVGNILASFQKNAKAKKCENGMYYADYLKQLLFFTPNIYLSYRMMEVMELGMQSYPQYQNCRMDQMLVAMKYKLHFQSNPLFFSLVTIGNTYQGKFHFIKEVERSYIP